MTLESLFLYNIIFNKCKIFIKLDSGLLEIIFSQTL